jgi:hypothetical protein
MQHSKKHNQPTGAIPSPAGGTHTTTHSVLDGYRQNRSAPSVVLVGGMVVSRANFRAMATSGELGEFRH